MQRLQDVVKRDLDYIFNTYSDFTSEHTIQCGSIKYSIKASLQSDEIQMTADVSPLNAFSISLYYIDIDDDDFNKCLKKNAIIFVDGVAFRIVDSMLSNGLMTLSLERHGGR